MYRSSSINYIRSENPVFRWGYLCKSTSPRISKFKVMARIGVPQSDWVSGRAWGSPVIPLGPPQMRHGV
jgi:hypothetical protein